MTILFVDIAGSTSLIESSDAESAHALFTPAIRIMLAEVERFSGHIAKVMGDGVMAIFGVPHRLEDHAIRACHAALAIQEKIALYAEEVKRERGVAFMVRAGVNSGTVVLSVTSDGEHEAYDAIGSPVHLASRIESQTPPGAVALSRHTHALVEPLFECEALGAFALKGFSERELIYRLVRPRDPRSKGFLRSVAAPPMVGREMQVRQLEESVARLRRGQGGFVVVSGDAGCGKTRFMSECKNSLGAHLLWLEGQSSSYDQRISYWPFIEILSAWLSLPEQGSEERNWVLLVERLAEMFGAESEEVIPYIAALMGMRVREPYDVRVKFLDTEVLKGQILRAMWRLLERMASRQPVAVVIDDFHWADESSVSVVEHLLALCSQARILICITIRMEGDHASSAMRVARTITNLNAVEIELRPLNIEDGVALVERLIGKDMQTRYLRDQILYKAGGNPFFIEEVVRNLKASGVLVPHVGEPDSWTVTSNAVAVPDTIHDVVMARVDRLDARLKQLLNVGSVIGRSFLYVVLRAVAERVENVDETLGELKQRQFIEEAVQLPELMYRFRHALMQEAIYDSILLEQRKKLHGRIADTLAEIFSGKTGRVASILAFHYARAAVPDKALHYLLEAADQALKVAADAEALKYYEDALQTYGSGAAAPWEPWQRATIERRLAEVHLHRGNLEVSEAHFRRALEACGDVVPATRSGLFTRLLRELLIQFAHRLRGTSIAAPQDPLDRLHETHMRIYEAFSWLMLFVDQEKMVYAILKVLNLAESHRWAEGVAKASGGFGAVLDIIGAHRLARRYHVRAAEWAKASGNPPAQGVVATLFGLHEAHIGRWDGALDKLEAAHELASRTGDMMTWVASGVYKSFLLIDRGAFAEALAIGDRMAQQGREAAFDIALRSGLAIQGKLKWRLGAMDEALPLLREALKRAISSGDVIHVTDAWGELGLCLLEGGDIALAGTELALAEQFVRERNVKTFSIIPVLVGLAQLEVMKLQASGPQASPMALRRCRAAVAVGRHFYFGLPRALRTMGSCLWLLGRKDSAHAHWHESVEAASSVNARYELALTHIEIGQRTDNVNERRHGEELLWICRDMRQAPQEL